LTINALMFVVEVAASWSSGSVSLLADAVDFFGDAANYGLSLAVLSMALHVRSKALPSSRQHAWQRLASSC